ncbi:MAG: cytochrome c [Hyphomicrobiaceae bacterium]
MIKGTHLAAIAAAVLAGTEPALAADTSCYAAAQADQGHQLFNNHCAECHRPDLTGAIGPALVGTPFWQHWSGQSVEALFNFEHTKMPATNTGSLPGDEVMAITAYILTRNALPGGNEALDQARAKTLILPKSG